MYFVSTSHLRYTIDKRELVINHEKEIYHAESFDFANRIKIYIKFITGKGRPKNEIIYYI